MTTKLTRFGSSTALVIDDSILRDMNIDLETNLEVTSDGSKIIITPLNTDNKVIEVIKSLKKINKNHRSALEKLAK